MNLDYIIIACLAVCLILLIVFLAFFIASTKEIRRENAGLSKAFEQSSNKTISMLEAKDKVDSNNFSTIFKLVEKVNTEENQRNEIVRREVGESLQRLSDSQENKLENIRKTLNESINLLNDNNKRELSEIRKTVDDKLTEHLESTLAKSFDTVSKQLEAVYRSMGEMQTLANGVGDLKKVLSNTKTRGILGEYQLSGILKEILPEQQYLENVATVPGSSERVEFAVKFPSSETETVLLPIDAKFPAETYLHLQDAIDTGNKELIEACRKELIQRLKNEAKDIRSKYIQVPDTTEFGIMFLPTEGLYAEACNLGMMEILQRDYHITIAGPSTMAALLNSFQMGFRTLAIQKRSNEVWNILGKTKTEFGRFEETLGAVQKNLRQTNDKLEELVGTRTRAINKTLKNIESARLEGGEVPLLEEEFNS